MTLATSRRLLLGLTLASVLAAGCGAAGPPADAQKTVISFIALDCSDCGDQIAGDLRKVAGVHSASFDKRKAELLVVADPGVDVLAAAKKAKHEGETFDLVLGGGKGTYLPWKEPPAGADVKTIAEDGADIPDLKPHLVAGKVTIVDFGAKWCEPCRELDEHILKAMAGRGDLAYRKADVGDWDTPLGTRWLKGVPALPYVIVFDKAGQQVDAISGMDPARLDAAIAKAAGAP